MHSTGFMHMFLECLFDVHRIFVYAQWIFYAFLEFSCMFLANSYLFLRFLYIFLSMFGPRLSLRAAIFGFDGPDDPSELVSGVAPTWASKQASEPANASWYCRSPSVRSLQGIHKEMTYFFMDIHFCLVQQLGLTH